MTTTLQVRIDPKLKAKAQKKFQAMGLDLSSGVKFVLTQLVDTQEMHAYPTGSKALTIRAKWDKGVADALKNGKGFATAKEAMIDIFGKKEYERLSK